MPPINGVGRRPDIAKRKSDLVLAPRTLQCSYRNPAGGWGGGARSFGFIAPKLTVRSTVFWWHGSLRSRLQAAWHGKKATTRQTTIITRFVRIVLCIMLWNSRSPVMSRNGSWTAVEWVIIVRNGMVCDREKLSLWQRSSLEIENFLTVRIKNDYSYLWVQWHLFYREKLKF